MPWGPGISVACGATVVNRTEVGGEGQWGVRGGAPGRGSACRGAARFLCRLLALGQPMPLV